MTTREAATRYGVSERTVCRWAECGAPHTFTKPNGARRVFDAAALDAWLTKTGRTPARVLKHRAAKERSKA